MDQSMFLPILASVGGAGVAGYLFGLSGVSRIKSEAIRLLGEVNKLDSENRTIIRRMVDVGSENAELRYKLQRYQEQRKAAAEKGRKAQAVSREAARATTLAAAAITPMRPRDEVVAGVGEARRSRIASA